MSIIAVAAVAAVVAAGDGFTNRLESVDGKWQGNGVAVVVDPDGHVRISSPSKGLSWVRLEWEKAWPEDTLCLNDVWERSYGNLEWKRPEAKERMSPWYFLATSDGVTDGYGVETQPNALACWKIWDKGYALRIDLRAGSDPVLLGDRVLDAVRLVTRKGRKGESAFEAGRAFCRMMCPKPRFPKEPFYGYNDWYCAYGRNTATNFLKDAAYICECAKGLEVRPYVVMDDGWQENSPPMMKTRFGESSSGMGPWTESGTNFGMDMKTFCAKIAAIGARPGLWYRPFRAYPGIPDAWRLKNDSKFVDPTVPEVRKMIVEDVSRFRGWGFKLVKIDYITWDLCRIWGFAHDEKLFKDGSANWRDRSHTTCEVMKSLYAAMREGAGDDMIVLGCNALNHLAAGLFEMQRIGDDTSGYKWERTRDMGVNTLAFRSVQDRTFFVADADCVGLARPGAVPWEKNSQWLDLVARSGTALFVSWHRDLADVQVRTALSKAFRTAASGPRTGEPLDWTSTRFPSRWCFADGNADYAW